MPATPAKHVRFAKIKDLTDGFAEAAMLMQKAWRGFTAKQELKALKHAAAASKKEADAAAAEQRKVVRLEAELARAN